MSASLGFLRDILLAALGLLALAAPFLVSTRAHSETLPGPIPASVTQVIDGDTVRVRAKIWLGQEITTKVRLAGIDAPEIGSRAKCDAERAKGEEAKAYLDQLIGGRDVRLYEVAADKYAGRVDATVVLIERAANVDVGQRLMDEGLAVPYGTKPAWCASA